MPEYYEYGSVNGARIKTSPSNWLRKTFRWIPFFVGQNIEFQFEYEKLDNYNIEAWKRNNIVENFPERHLGVYTIPKLHEPEEKLVTQPLKSTYKVSREGDIEYRVCESDYFKKGAPIFSTRVQSRDRISLFIYGTIFGGLITALIGVLIKWISGMV
jgi:hypothetical protein